MADFLITELVLCWWLGWVLAVLAVVGIVYASLWVSGLVMFCSDWLGFRRQVWRSKAAVRRHLADADGCGVCALAEAEIAELEAGMGDDPPEYQHPDGDDDDLPAEPHEDEVVAFLAAVRKMGLLEDGPGEDDCLPEPPRRCDDPECDKYGWVHPPPCLILPTMPIGGLAGPGRPAGPPVPWSGYSDSQALHPASVADLEAAGFGRHDTVDGVADSAFTKAEALEVIAMVTDGVIPGDETGRSHR